MTTSDRRSFLAAAISLLPQTRERRIGFGRDPATGELRHEEYAVEFWNGSEWADTHERRIWWLISGQRHERRYKLRYPELGF
jgi:hypothetical protein